MISTPSTGRSLPMARKPRDYKREYARRKAKAQERGYSSPRKLYQSNIDRQLQAWSDKHSANPISKFDPTWSRSKKRAYYRAWVGPKWDPDKPGSANINEVRRGHGDRAAFEHWMIDVTHHYTVNDFDRRYPLGHSPNVHHEQTKLF